MASMKVERVKIFNIKCFKEEEINLSNRINVIVGPNNNGKTTLLNCISVLQQPNFLTPHYNRIDSNRESLVRIWLDRIDIPGINPATIHFKHSIGSSYIECFDQHNHMVQNWTPLLNQEPQNYIIPYQSKRKVGGYYEGILLTDVNQVTGTLSNLYAKIDRICNPQYQPAYDEYIKACNEILGFVVSTTNSMGGKKAAYIIRNDLNIPIDMMGEGIPNLLGLIVDLCRVENKLFIIEELENDVHPKALKKLLDLIIKKSLENQFIITTHSNIVLRHLGSAENARVFNIEMALEDKIPTSTINVVDTPAGRRRVLEELGYELYDYNLWEYWIFFEESSAERIVREYLIPWFVPELISKVRTFSAGSLSQVTPKFEDFNRLFVFIHLQEIYKNRVWVVVDAGENENQIICQLRSKYEPSGWQSSNFRQFTKHDFEEYYPSQFQEQVKLALGEPNKAVKKEAKLKLFKEVMKFISEDEKSAKGEFEKSAADVIDMIREIALGVSKEFYTT
jgi:hypothetical protein